MDIVEGWVLKLKKPHPCGGMRWKVLRTGMDIRLQCETCGHTLLLPRSKVEKQIRSMEPPVSEEEQKTEKPIESV